MDDVQYEHECAWAYGWCACGVALASFALLAVDLADRSAGPVINPNIGSATYAAVAAAGATIQPSNRTRAVPAHTIAMDERIFEGRRFDQLALFGEETSR